MFASPPAGPRAPRSLPGRSGCNEALLNTRLQVWVDRSFPLLWVSTKARGCWIVRYECAQSREKLPAQLRRFAPPRALSDGPRGSTPGWPASALRFDHAAWCAAASPWRFNWRLPDDTWYGASFHTLTCGLHTFFTKHLFRSLARFLILLFIFLSLNVVYFG